MSLSNLYGGPNQVGVSQGPPGASFIGPGAGIATIVGAANTMLAHYRQGVKHANALIEQTDQHQADIDRQLGPARKRARPNIPAARLNPSFQRGKRPPARRLPRGRYVNYGLRYKRRKYKKKRRYSQY